MIQPEAGGGCPVKQAGSGCLPHLVQALSNCAYSFTANGSIWVMIVPVTPQAARR
jgi:hypothetical protein